MGGGKFEPKTPVNLNPPKDDPITLEELAKADGTEGQKAYGKVYDVTGNKMYQTGGNYNVFAGKDASRALAKSSTKPEDVQAEWKDLDEEKIGVLNDWITFFSKRYNIVGVVQGATNMDRPPFPPYPNVAIRKNLKYTKPVVATAGPSGVQLILAFAQRVSLINWGAAYVLFNAIVVSGTPGHPHASPACGSSGR
ncbi:cytochrome b5-like heme/steroid binding domain-containing protein [Nemania sp. FL0031]|nr:cytochrome b5-like heme/steroid binding domain-containing protein [Nemania sp. FL0031]